MLEEPLTGKQISNAVKDGLKNLSANKHSFANTEESIVEKLVKSKLGLKYGSINLFNKIVKDELHSTYYESQIIGKVNPAKVSIIEGETLFCERTILESEILFTNRAIFENGGYPANKLVNRRKLFHRGKLD